MADAVIWVYVDGAEGPDSIGFDDEVFIVRVGEKVTNDVAWTNIKTKYGATEASRLIQTATIVPFTEFKRAKGTA